MSFLFSCTAAPDYSAVGYGSRRRKFEGRRRPAPPCTRDDSDDDRCMHLGADVSSMDRSCSEVQLDRQVGDSAISITSCITYDAPGNACAFHLVYDRTSPVHSRSVVILLVLLYIYDIYKSKQELIFRAYVRSPLKIFFGNTLEP